MAAIPPLTRPAPPATTAVPPQPSGLLRAAAASPPGAAHAFAVPAPRLRGSTSDAESNSASDAAAAMKKPADPQGVVQGGGGNSKKGGFGSGAADGFAAWRGSFAYSLLEDFVLELSVAVRGVSVAAVPENHPDAPKDADADADDAKKEEEGGGGGSASDAAAAGGGGGGSGGAMGPPLGPSTKKKVMVVPQEGSPAVVAMVALLDELFGLLERYPATAQPTRYGNMAYRSFYDAVEKAAEGMLLKHVLSEELLRSLGLEFDREGAARELGQYLVASIGNYQRIDYGTGHETAFIQLLLCLRLLGVFRQADHCALVTRVFVRYLDVMRRAQDQYCLEPAGSHGVWGLDDYQFVPFLWGASQLIGHPHIRPKSIHSADVVAMYASEYLYLGGIDFIKKHKTGVFAEHSPLLFDISHVPHQLWQKLNIGLHRTWLDEVMDKYPVIQHTLFGSLFPFDDPPGYVRRKMGPTKQEALLLAAQQQEHTGPPPTGSPAAMAAMAPPPGGSAGPAAGAGVPMGAAPWARPGAAGAPPSGAAPWARPGAGGGGGGGGAAAAPPPSGAAPWARPPPGGA